MLTMSQSSSIDENIDVNDEREPLDNRGDADGSSLSSESNKVVDNIVEEKETFETKLKDEDHVEVAPENEDSSCSCKRTETRSYEENGSVLLGAWNELRSSLRQLYRSVIPTSLNKSGLPNPRNRPSINRIKALSNMLVSHDPHQLFTRVNQLSQELCIELKVRLLATIHDSPEIEEAKTFIKGLCDSYDWVVSVCEAIQTAFEKLDSDHLSRFGLNWMTVNMHTFYATIFTDPDVQDYLNICNQKIENVEEAEGCAWMFVFT
ncbi:hypothetical protein Avbf_01063 [Armadillidium vulgare]|nr:hypothetical protein Avbf_01063 [Armadillidium vulgare]